MNTLDLDKSLKELILEKFSQPDFFWGVRSITLSLLLLICVLVSARHVSFLNFLWLVPLVGWVYYRLYFPLHELSHFSLLPKRKHNIVFGYIFGGILFTPFDNFRKEHLLHHHFYGTQKDPGSIDYYVKFNNRKEMMKFLLFPILGFNFLKKISDYFLVKKSNHQKSIDINGYISIALIHTAIFFYVTNAEIANFWRYPVFILLPGITVFLFLSRLRMFLEHGSLNYDRVDFTKEAHVISRTFSSNNIELLLLSGAAFKYHYEHHLLPGIPACHLESIHENYIYPNYISEENYKISYIAALKELWSNLS